MRRLVCLFLASLFVSQDALAQGALIAGLVELAVDFSVDFIEGLDGTAVAIGLALLLLGSIVILLAMTWLIEKAFDKVFKGEEISIWPSVSTFIAFVIVSVSGGILIGIEDVIQLDFDEVIKVGIPFVAILGFLPAIFVWVVKHFLRYLARRLRNAPEPLEESLEP